MDRSFTEQNRASTERLRKLVARLNEADMSRRVGPDWTVAVALAHLAFWDRRVQLSLERTEKEGKLSPVDLDPSILNDLLLPTWELIRGQEAALLALETAETLDRRLELFPESLLEQVQAHNPRWVLRALHRNEHLDEVEAALQ